MKGFKEFLGEEDGVAIIEIVKSLNTKILKKITIESNKLL